MTKEYFIELSEYNIWANDIACSWLEKISDEQWKRPVVSSFPSIYETVLHMAAAEDLWLNRLKKHTNLQLLVHTFKGSKAGLISIWKEASLALKQFIQEMPTEQFGQKLFFKNTKGVEYNQAYYQLLAHIINHATYHRGQLVTMLRQVGFTDVSSVDMTTYFRSFSV